MFSFVLVIIPQFWRGFYLIAITQSLQGSPSFNKYFLFLNLLSETCIIVEFFLFT